MFEHVVDFSELLFLVSSLTHVIKKYQCQCQCLNALQQGDLARCSNKKVFGIEHFVLGCEQ